MKCLAKEPAARPQTACELRELLDACEDVGPWTQAEAREWWESARQDIAAVRHRRRGRSGRRGRVARARFRSTTTRRRTRAR